MRGRGGDFQKNISFKKMFKIFQLFFENFSQFSKRHTYTTPKIPKGSRNIQGFGLIRAVLLFLGKKGKGGKGKKKGKFKLAFPICTAPEGPRMPHGAPPVNFIPKMLPLTDWSKFSRDNAPKNAIMDDCIW